MGKRIQKLSPRLINFIGKQKMFFVATAMDKGQINISPKGMDAFRVLDNKRVMWLNLTGSGNETAAHIKHNNRMTIMFCAFEGPPMILRLYGTAKVYHERDPEWEEHISLFPTFLGSRQIMDMQLALVQISCGFGVPFMEFKGERELLGPWAEEKEETGLREYMKLKNSKSLDGYPTGIFE